MTRPYPDRRRSGRIVLGWQPGSIGRSLIRHPLDAGTLQGIRYGGQLPPGVIVFPLYGYIVEAYGIAIGIERSTLFEQEVSGSEGR